MTDSDYGILRHLFLGTATATYADGYDLRRLEAEWQSFRNEKGHALEAGALPIDGLRDGALGKEELAESLKPMADVMWNWCIGRAVDRVVGEKEERKPKGK